MALSTFTQIYQRVRTRLGDDEVVGGQVFTDAYLSIHMPDIWANTIGAMSKWGLPYTEKESFVLVQPHQSYVDLQRSGLPNPGAIFEVWAGTPSVVTQVPLSPAPSTDPATGFIRLEPASLTGFQTGDEVMVLADPRFQGVVNDVWTVTISAPFMILNGCFATIRPSGDYAGATPGRVAKVDQSNWRQLRPIDDYNPGTRSEQGSLPNSYAYRGQVMRLEPVAATQQILSVSYYITGDASFVSTDSPVVADDMSRVLVPYLAGVACQSKGQPGFQDFYVEALGQPVPIATGEGGALGEYIALKVKEMQRAPLQKGRFREKNTTLRLGRGWVPGRGAVLPYS